MRYTEKFKQDVIAEVRRAALECQPISATAHKFDMPVQTLYNWIYRDKELLDFLNGFGWYKLNKWFFEPRVMKLQEEKEENKNEKGIICD